MFCVRRAGDRDDAREEALEPFVADFHKILKICPDDERCEIVRMSDADRRSLPADSARLSDWFDAFAAEGGGHSDDLADCRAFADFTNLRRLVESGARHPSCRCRRKCGDAFRWIILELFPCVEQPGPKTWAMLCVRDIEDHCAEDMERIDSLESVRRRDDLTGLKGRRAFAVECGMLRQDSRLFLMGMALARLHAGEEDDAARDAASVALADSLADIFRRDSCFRLDADPFAVLLPDIPESV